jgi:cytochrome c peroxidase
MGQSPGPVRLTASWVVAVGATALALAALLWSADPAADGPGAPALAPTQTQALDLETLGRLLFFDPNLSRNRTQSCATCHDPSAGFADPRGEGELRAVSLGDDGHSLGDRNAPTASYARFSPAFHRTLEGKYLGGQFLDGREADLVGQAGGPPLNPIEMGMPDKASVVARLRENSAYAAAFAEHFGAGVWDDVEAAYLAMAEAIAAFEGTDFFAPFDSKYDRHLRGEYQMTAEEELGMTLFFSTQFTNCHLCHQLHKLPGSAGETFSNYEFHNIGVPVNRAVRAKNGQPEGHVDIGLAANPAVKDQAQAGRFKTPTLRNVAITGPYMHNGVFKDLRSVIFFYNKYNSRAPRRQIDPETGAAWAPPEVSGNLSLEGLEAGPALDDQRIDALVAFLKTLTDRRYEHLQVGD